MEEMQKVTFAVEEEEITLEELNESQFMKCRIRAFADGMTEHKFYFSLDKVKESEFTILGKPLLWKYNIFKDDANSHDADEVPCGFIPKTAEEAEVEYVYDENLDKTFMITTAYIWKNYSEDLERILNRDDGHKTVSVELKVKAHKSEDKTYDIVDAFLFTGVTILGDHISSAVKGADLQVVKFSLEDFNKAKDEFEIQLNSVSNTESSQEDSFLLQKNSEDKEDNMEENQEIKDVNNSAEEMQDVYNATAYVNTSVTVSQYTNVYDNDGKYVGSEDEYHSKSTTVVVDIPEDSEELEDNNNSEELEDQTNADGEQKEAKDEDNGASESVDCSAEKVKELEVKCSAYETELNEMKEKYAALELKCSVLEEFKTNTENAQKEIEVNCALDEVSNILSAQEISEWREKSLNCANVDSFKNELKAYAFDVQQKNGHVEMETLRNSLSTQEEKPKSVWDRLKRI